MFRNKPKERPPKQYPIVSKSAKPVERPVVAASPAPVVKTKQVKVEEPVKWPEPEVYDLSKTVRRMEDIEYSNKYPGSPIPRRKGREKIYGIK